MASFIPNPRFKEQVLHSTLLLADLKAVAERIAGQAKAMAPIESGEYRDMIEAEAGLGANGAQGTIIAGAPYSGFLEFGTVDTPVFAPLRRGAEAAGYRLKA